MDQGPAQTCILLNMSYVTSNFKLSLPPPNIFSSNTTKFTYPLNHMLQSGSLPRVTQVLGSPHTLLQPLRHYTLYTAYQVLHTMFRCLLTADQCLFSRGGYVMPLIGFIYIYQCSLAFTVGATAYRWLWATSNGLLTFQRHLIQLQVATLVIAGKQPVSTHNIGEYGKMKMQRG